jgi:hypothetical protein
LKFLPEKIRHRFRVLQMLFKPEHSALSSDSHSKPENGLNDLSAGGRISLKLLG